MHIRIEKIKETFDHLGSSLRELETKSSHAGNRLHVAATKARKGVEKGNDETELKVSIEILRNPVVFLCMLIGEQSN